MNHLGFKGILLCLLLFSAGTASVSALPADKVETSNSLLDLPTTNSYSPAVSSYRGSPDITVSVAQSEERQNMVLYTWYFDVREDTDGLAVGISQVQSYQAEDVQWGVTRWRGFSEGDRTGEFIWDQRTQNPSFTIAIVVRSGTASSTPHQNAAATGKWLFTPLPLVGISWYERGSSNWETTVPLMDEQYNRLNTDIDGSGVIGVGFLYLGPYTEYSQKGGGQVFRLIVPSDASLAESPKEILTALTDASQYMVGSIHDEILMFALPNPMRRGGRALSRSGEFWVHASSRLDHANNVWFHEFMHTRQTYEVSRDMEWFTEASAEYHAAVITAAQGRISNSELRRYFSSDSYDDEILSQPESWSDDQVPYRKGSRVLFVLDDKINKASNNERWLGDVIVGMHHQEEEIEYTDFRNIVTDVAGSALGDWLDKYVMTSSAPSVQTPLPPSEARTTTSTSSSDRTAQDPSQYDEVPTATPSYSDSDDGSPHLFKALFGGLAGYWIWNREEKQERKHGFTIGLAISILSFMSFFMGICGVVIYLLARRKMNQRKFVSENGLTDSVENRF